MLLFTSIDNKDMKTRKYQYSRHKSTRQQTSSTVIFSEEKEQI